MHALRTPDNRFTNLPDFDFAPHYADVANGEGAHAGAADITGGEADKLRVHYLDEGPADAAPVLLMHGEPSWCFLYRHMIPALVAAGHRVIAPDLVGFGRSDKPMQQSDYSYQRHVDWMHELIFDVLDLNDITLFCQDWGGLIGLRLVAAKPDRFARVVVGNTGLPNGQGEPSQAFLAWQNFSQTSPTFPIGSIINGGTSADLSAEVIAGYDAPFPDDTYTAGARIFPTLVPTSTNDPAAPANIAAWGVLSTFAKPFLCAFSDQDAITKGGDKPFRQLIPGAQGQAHTTIEGAGHFLQEDAGPQLAQVIIDFIAATS